MKAKIIPMLIILVLLATLTPSAYADASGQQGENLMAQVGEVVPFETTRYERLPAQANGESGLGVNACKTYTLGVNGYSAVGIKIWSYAWNIQWCYNGSTITSLSKWRTVWANYGWSFKGDVAENQSGGVGKTSYWHYAQGDFCLIETWTCITHSYPWVNQTVYGTGAYTGSAGGN